MRKSLQVSLIAVFAALHAMLYFISFRLGPWRNWGIYLESFEGIILGSNLGFFAALIGSSVARMIVPDPLWMFGIIAEPVSVMSAGFLAKAKWKPVLVLYLIMLVAYLIHPFGSALPLWTILDILFALFLIYPAAKFGKNLFRTDVKPLSFALVLISFVCIATDSLIRVFLLVPVGLHSLFFAGFDELYGVFVSAAFYSYIEDFVVVAVSVIVGVPLLIRISKLGVFENKEKKE